MVRVSLPSIFQASWRPIEADTDGTDRFQSWQNELDVDDVRGQLDAETENGLIVCLLTGGDGQRRVLIASQTQDVYRILASECSLDEVDVEGEELGVEQLEHGLILVV